MINESNDYFLGGKGVTIYAVAIEHSIFGANRKLVQEERQQGKIVISLL